METQVHRVYRRHPAQTVPTRSAQARPPQERRETENLQWRPLPQAAATRLAQRPTEDLPWRPQRRPAQPPPPRPARSAPRRQPTGRAGRLLRPLLLLALVAPGLAWLYVQAPRLLPFTARHGAHPGWLLLAVVALVIAAGLKQVVWFKTMQRVAPPLSEE